MKENERKKNILLGEKWEKCEAKALNKVLYLSTLTKMMINEKKLV
jgi:hypothetical protein